MSTPDLARPTVDDVAALLRARTKDSNGTEVGTFDDDTRPTATEVESHIDTAVLLVGSRLPPTHLLPADLQGAIAGLVAYRAAMRIEKSYFPEQVRSDRSAYTQLREEYLDDLAAVMAAVEGGGGGEAVAASDFVSLPVGSWTSIPNDWITPPSTIGPPWPVEPAP